MQFCYTILSAYTFLVKLDKFQAPSNIMHLTEQICCHKAKKNLIEIECISLDTVCIYLYINEAYVVTC